MSPAELERHAGLINALIALAGAKRDDWRMLNGAAWGMFTTPELTRIADGILFVCGRRDAPP